MAIDTDASNPEGRYAMKKSILDVSLQHRRQLCDIFVINQAFDFARALRTESLLVFFASMTLKRAKSFKDRLCSMAALFCAHRDLLHFSTICSFSTSFLTTKERAARGSPVNFNGVRVRCL